MKTRTPIGAGPRCQSKFIAVMIALCSTFWAGESFAKDKLSCEIDDDHISCDVDIRDFINDEIREVLYNGWENSLHFHLVLTDDSGEVVGLTYAEVSQRCYIDPFDDPCLALWAGSTSWDTYLDLDSMIEAVGRFKLDSVDVDELSDGLYQAALSFELNPITAEQASLVRKWLARNRGGHLVVGRGDSTIFGTFVSLFANIRSGHAEAEFELASKAFRIGEAPKPEPEEED